MGTNNIPRSLKFFKILCQALAMFLQCDGQHMPEKATCGTTWSPPLHEPIHAFWGFYRRSATATSGRKLRIGLAECADPGEPFKEGCGRRLWHKAEEGRPSDIGMRNSCARLLLVCLSSIGGVPPRPIRFCTEDRRCGKARPPSSFHWAPNAH